MKWNIWDKIMMGLGIFFILFLYRLWIPEYANMLSWIPLWNITTDSRIDLMFVNFYSAGAVGYYLMERYSKYQPKKEIITFRGKQYEFVGDSNIQCSCLSNGSNCNQRQMEKLNDSPFIGKSDEVGYLCLRMWKEV